MLTSAKPLGAMSNYMIKFEIPKNVLYFSKFQTCSISGSSFKRNHYFWTEAIIRLKVKSKKQFTTMIIIFRYFLLFKIPLIKNRNQKIEKQNDKKNILSLTIQIPTTQKIIVLESAIGQFCLKL